MPRDLKAEKDGILNSMSSLDRSENEHSSGGPSGLSPPGEVKDRIMRDMEREDKINEVKPYVQALNLQDVDSCVRLEDAAFPPNERATREKFIYRFTKCGELCLGLFTSGDIDVGDDPSTALTAETANPVYSGAPARKQVLLGHVVVTKSKNSTVADDDMAVPSDWEKTPTLAQTQGHQEDGKTICVHSLAILPEYQRRGLGRLLMKSYIQRIEASGVADRIALIAHKEFAPFYGSLGFQDLGQSKAQFGGGGWIDMALDLKNQPGSGDTGSPSEL